VRGKKEDKLQIREGVMVVRNVDRNAIGLNEDWEGNNAAFSCPTCNKVFIVSALLHGGQRECPNCGKSKGYVHGSKQAGGSASITWDNSI
jgi:predicted RNA-binding Zn-ribbon protein involved in translation (DUF1610 family)